MELGRETEQAEPYGEMPGGEAKWRRQGGVIWSAEGQEGEDGFRLRERQSLRLLPFEDVRVLRGVCIRQVERRMSCAIHSLTDAVLMGRDFWAALA